jgi:hypothetical protein
MAIRELMSSDSRGNPHIRCYGARRIRRCLAGNAPRTQPPLNFSAISTSRRSASDREGLSGWRFAHASTSAVSAGGARKVSTGSLPVAGRPRFLGITFFVLDALAILGVT